MKIFPELVEKIKADHGLQQRLLKDLGEVDGEVGELPQVFEQEEPDIDEFELAMTDLSEKTTVKVHGIFCDITK